MKIQRILLIISLFFFMRAGEGVWAVESSKSYMDPFKQKIQLSHEEGKKTAQNPRELEQTLLRFAIPSATRRKYTPLLKTRKNASGFYFQKTLKKLASRRRESTPEVSLRERTGRGTMRMYGVRR